MLDLVANHPFGELGHQRALGLRVKFVAMLVCRLLQQAAVAATVSYCDLMQKT